jgi:hypothetical protein
MASSPGSAIYLGSTWKLGYAHEATYGTDPGTAAYSNAFGVVQNATIPDPNVNFNPIWALGTASYRNWYIAYKGQITLGGSIPDVWLLDGKLLKYPFGSVNTGGGDPYTHTISEAFTLPSLAMQITNNDSAGSTGLMRRFIGGKVNRATISASEADFLKMSIDEILFLNYLHNISGFSDDTAHYSASVADITLDYPATQPYLFSYGSLSLGGTVFARIRGFSLSISNNLDPKYYITSSAIGGTQLPYEYREGRREYQLTVTIDVEDNSLYKELVRMGSYTNVYKGFQAIIAFTRGANDSITLTMPGSAPAAGGDAMGCLISQAPHNITTDPVVSVTLSMLVRSVSVVVIDSIAGGDY